MRSLLSCIPLALAGHVATAQHVHWLTDRPVGWSLNPGMPEHVIASAPGHLVAMRTLDVALNYGTKMFGTVALDALDPGTGAPLLSCMLGDSVAVGAAAVDAAGIAYFAGRFMGDALELCDGSQLPGVVPGPFGVNHFLLAWDIAAGVPLWARNLSADHTSCDDVPSLAFDPEGRLWYIMQDFFDGRVVRVDDAGNDMEVRPISGIRRFGTISFDPWGGLYVSGACENGTLTFGEQSFPVQSAGGYNMFVLRFRPDGTAGFAEFAEDVTFQDPAVATGSDGRAYLAGGLLSNAAWGDVQFEAPAWGGGVFLTALDSTGHFFWGVASTPASGPINGDMQRSSGPCIAVGDDDHVYLIGTIRGSIDWGDGVVSGSGNLQERRLTLVAFDAEGAPLWGSTSAPSLWAVTGQAVTAHADEGSVHFAAHVADPFTMGEFTVSAEDAQAAVIGRIGSLPTNLPDAIFADGPAVWPNPTTDDLFIDHAGSGALPAGLLNSTGQMVQRFTLLPGCNRTDVQTLPAGLYLLQLADGRAVRVVKE